MTTTEDYLITKAREAYTNPSSELDLYFKWKGARVLIKDEESRILIDWTTGKGAEIMGKYLIMPGEMGYQEFFLGDGATACGMHPENHDLEAIAGRCLLMAFEGRNRRGLMKTFVSKDNIPLDIVVGDDEFLPVARLILDKYGFLGLF